MAMRDNETPVPSIDFVIAWVDGSDPAWKAERDKWLALEEEHPWIEWSTGDQRFRDWGLLRYWFRGVEAFAPWVNKIHFVTWGHVPSWLNLGHPKLNVVRHEDYIPEQYLPTFCSRAIELNLHRIEGLADRFVYFNDDVFLTRPVKPSQFFRGGLPRDFAGMEASYHPRSWANAQPFNACIINQHFDKQEVLREGLGRWLNPKYGPKVIAKTLGVLPYKEFTGFQTNHLSYNLLKHTFAEAWDTEPTALDATCRHRFRRQGGCNIWLIQDWQRVKGEFAPMSPHLGASLSDRFMTDRKNTDRFRSEIERGRWAQVVVNDECANEEDFLFWRSLTQRAFGQLLPNACSFEVD